MRDTLQCRPRPTGWGDLGGRTPKLHWFSDDGRSLCGKWANLTRNILLRDDDVHADNRCAACNRKRAKLRQ